METIAEVTVSHLEQLNRPNNLRCVCQQRLHSISKKSHRGFYVVRITVPCLTFAVDQSHSIILMCCLKAISVRFIARLVTYMRLIFQVSGLGQKC